MVSGITFIYGNVFSPVDSHGHKATSTLQTLKNGSWTVRIVRYQVQIYFELWEFMSMKNNIPLSMPIHSNTVHHHVRTDINEMCTVAVVINV